MQHAFRADIRDICTAHTSVEPGQRTCGNDRPGGVMMFFIDRLAEAHPEVHPGAEHVHSRENDLVQFTGCLYGIGTSGASEFWDGITPGMFQHISA